MTDTTLKERYTGCLLGGAVGDALGWLRLSRRWSPAELFLKELTSPSNF